MHEISLEVFVNLEHDVVQRISTTDKWELLQLLFDHLSDEWNEEDWKFFVSDNDEVFQKLKELVKDA